MDIALIGVAVVLLIVIVILFAAVKIAREYERGVVFRLGRLSASRRARACSS